MVQCEWVFIHVNLLPEDEIPVLCGGQWIKWAGLNGFDVKTQLCYLAGLGHLFH